MHGRVAVLALAASVFCLRPLSAEIVPLAQLRQIVAGGSVNTIDESVNFYDAKTADDFDAFSASTGLALRTEFGTATADGYTSQVSTISPTEILALATSDTFVYAPNEQDTAYGSTVSQFSLRFLLTTPGYYHLTADGFAANNANATMSLRDASDQELVYFDPLLWPPVDQVLFLVAGEYGLSVGADSNGFYEFGSGNADGRSEINVLFRQVPVPEPRSLLLAIFGVAAVLAARKSIRPKNAAPGDC